MIRVLLLRWFFPGFFVFAGSIALLGQGDIKANTNTPAFPFVDGERWCVLGDSITHGGSYHRVVELFHLTRYPGKRLEVINCGISGDSAKGALNRLDWDCLTNKPTVVSVMLGMNDVSRGLYASNADSASKGKRAEVNARYEANMTNLVSKILASGARPVLITPSPFDDTAADSAAIKFASNMPGCGEALRGYARKISEWGAKSGIPVVDFSAPMTSLNVEKQTRDSSFTLIGKDRIHPGPVGHLVMAYEFLKSQGVDGPVSLMAVDASGETDIGSSNCRISDIRSADDGVSFKCLENSIPCPLTNEQLPALNLVPFTKDLNSETLRIKGLSPGVYTLKIDGANIRDYSAVDLSEGVNLALQTNTPQMLQALEVLNAMSKKWDAAGKIRTIVWNEIFAFPDAPRPIPETVDVAKKYDEKLAAMKTKNPYFIKIRQHYTEYKSHEAEIRTQLRDSLELARQTAVPREHTFTVTKVPAR